MAASRSTHFVFRVPRKVVFALVTLAFLLAAGEIGQRISDWRKFQKQSVTHATDGMPRLLLETTSGVPLTADRWTNGAMLHDPWLVVRPKPNQECGGIRYNSLGLRGGDWAREKPPGTLRVAVLGGSTAFGLGIVDDQKVYAAVLERTLRASAPSGTAVEVLNAGVSGYDAMQEMVLFGSRVLDYAPDIVIVLDGWNNFYFGSLTPPEKEVPSPNFYEVDDALARSESLPRSLLHFSALYRGIAGRLESWREAQKRTSGEFGRYNDYPRALPYYRRELEMICRVARGASCKVLIVTQPELEQRTPVPDAERGVHDGSGEDYARLAKAQYPHFRDAARDVAKAEGALYDDATPIFNGVPEVVFTDRVHLNERGNELLALHLLPIVARALGWDAGAPR